MLILDPYCSPLSTLAYRRLHHERTDLSAAPFADDERIGAAPLESNQARATLAFFRGADEYAARWPELPMVERRRVAVLAYPLSGGFTKRPLVPAASTSAVVALERVLAPALAPLAAFRCLVVIERR